MSAHPLDIALDFAAQAHADGTIEDLDAAIGFVPELERPDYYRARGVVDPIWFGVHWRDQP